MIQFLPLFTNDLVIWQFLHDTFLSLNCTKKKKKRQSDWKVDFPMIRTGRLRSESINLLAHTVTGAANSTGGCVRNGWTFCYVDILFLYKSSCGPIGTFYDWFIQLTQHLHPVRRTPLHALMTRKPTSHCSIKIPVHDGLLYTLAGGIYIQLYIRQWKITHMDYSWFFCTKEWFEIGNTWSVKTVWSSCTRFE